MFLFRLFAHKKGVGSSRNGRDSAAKRLGIKRADGQKVSAGSICCYSSFTCASQCCSGKRR